MEYRKIRHKKHYIYDHISEFYNAHPKQTPLKNWREGKQGDWVWSDDGKIVQLLKVVDKIKERKMGFDESKAVIRQLLLQDLQDKAFQDWFFKLKKNSRIEVNYELLQKIY